MHTASEHPGPSVSVIITNFNYARYLADAVESALRQTYAKVEVIVVDDGSTDGSLEILERYRGSVTALRQQNGGQAAAFNAGFAKSSGDIVLFLDADDTLASHALEKIVAAWDGDFVKLHFNLSVVDADGSKLGHNYFTGELPGGDMAAVLLRDGHCDFMPTSGNAFSRRLLSRILPMPTEDWRQSADVYLCNLAALYGPVGAIQEALGTYRVHGTNQSSHIVGNRVNLKRIEFMIGREINTDRMLAEHSLTVGKHYRAGTLLTSFPHQQLRLIYSKLGGQREDYRIRGLVRAFILSQATLAMLPAIGLTKKVMVGAWMTLFLVAVGPFAERLVVFGYNRGAVFSVRRRPSARKQALSRLGGTLAQAVRAPDASGMVEPG